MPLEQVRQAWERFGTVMAQYGDHARLALSALRTCNTQLCQLQRQLYAERVRRWQIRQARRTRVAPRRRS